jgi:hypothetical protein
MNDYSYLLGKGNLPKFEFIKMKEKSLDKIRYRIISTKSL